MNSSIGDYRFEKGQEVEVQDHIGNQLLSANRGILIPIKVKEKMKADIGVSVDVDVDGDDVDVDAEVDVDLSNIDKDKEDIEEEIEDMIEDIVEDIVENTVKDSVRDSVKKINSDLTLENRLNNLSWTELKNLAKEKGISTFGVKKEAIISKLIQVINNEQ